MATCERSRRARADERVRSPCRPVAWAARSLLVLVLVLVGCGGASPVAQRFLPEDLATPSGPDPAPARGLFTPGPIPDFAPMRVIATHEDLSDMAPGLLPELQLQLGRGHVVIDRRQVRAHDPEPTEVEALDDTLVWKRDYQPIYVRDHVGKVTALHYLADNPNRVRAPTHHDAQVRDRVMPLVHENGNLVTNGRFVFVTDQILDENAEPREERHLLEHGYRARRPDEVLRVLSQHLLRPVEDIIVLPTMPYEATGHVDLFLLPLDERTVIVPVIEPKVMALLAEERVRHIAQVIRVFLDEQASYLRDLGLEVLRLPMIPPAMGVYPEDDEAVTDGLFELLVFSPANALLANVDGRRHVFLPGFDEVAELPALAKEARSYTARWEEAFRERGWAPHVVDASALVAYLGLFRCVTAAIPEASAVASATPKPLAPGRVRSMVPGTLANPGHQPDLPRL